MASPLIQLAFDKIMQMRAYTVVILMAQEKRFAIYIDPNIGKILQLFLTDMSTPRPTTHELINKIFNGIKMKVKQIVINDVQDTIYYARIFLEQEIHVLVEQEMRNILHIIEIDARPSDCLILALAGNHIPMFCTQEVLNKVILIED